MRARKPQVGFSPIEMLVGLAVSLLLVLGIAELVARQHSTARAQEEQSRMEDAGRFGACPNFCVNGSDFN